MKKIIVDGQEYIPSDSVQKLAPAELVRGMAYCIVRGYQSVVWAGYVKSQEGTKVVLLNVRNIWYWKGAASLSQLSQEGIKDLSDSKITQEIPEFTMLDANSILPCSEAAKKLIAESPVWKS